MGSFFLTRRAENDLFEIGEYTVRTWGTEQCVRYIDGLEACCQKLADNPKQGRSCENLRPGYWRMEQGKHVIFYRIDEDGIVIARILHVRMLPRLHLNDDGDE
jgi:toxin ParE1/3/4